MTRETCTVERTEHVGLDAVVLSSDLIEPGSTAAPSLGVDRPVFGGRWVGRLRLGVSGGGFGGVCAETPWGFFRAAVFAPAGGLVLLDPIALDPANPRYTERR